MEWAILVEKAHQSGQRLGTTLIYISVEVIYAHVTLLQLYEFNNILI